MEENKNQENIEENTIDRENQSSDNNMSEKNIANIVNDESIANDENAVNDEKIAIDKAASDYTGRKRTKEKKLHRQGKSII